MKKLKDGAVYSDVVNAGLILKRKKKYTFTDFKKLVNEGWDQIDALWIVTCSAAYYNAEMSKRLETNKFLDLCKCGIAIL